MHKTMKKVLMIAYHFPPIGGSGMQRTVKFVKYLPGFGWEPVVLSVKKGTHYELIDSSLMNEIPQSVKIYRTTWFNPLGLITIPNKKIGWLPCAFFKGINVLRREKISVIYSTSPTVTAHLIAYLLKKATKLPWVADFRDPWIGNPACSEDVGFRKRIEIFLERKVVTNADRIIANTELFRADFMRRYPDVDESKFITITNGYDPEDFEKVETVKESRKNGKFVLTHTGEFYDKIRNPENFLKAVGAMVNEGQIEKKNLVINFIGSGEYTGMERYKALLGKHSLQDIVNDVPHLPHKESIKSLLSSNVLLLFNFTNGSLQVPAKTYEYINAGKPILTISEEGATTRLLREEHIGAIVSPNDVHAIKGAILKLYMDFKNGKKLDGAAEQLKQKFNRKLLTQRLAGVFDGLCNVETGN